MIAEELEPVMIRGPENSAGESTIITIRLEDLSVQKPRYNASATASSGIMRNLLPMQCKLAGSNYLGDLYGGISVSFNLSLIHI